jgi:hypothetical protein
MSNNQEAEIKVLYARTEKELKGMEKLSDSLKNTPIPQNEILENLGLYIPRQSLTRMIFMHDLYKLALPTNGVVMEFGTRWGQNLALFNNFRGMYEPYNFTRKIIGFDTFSGFLSVDEKDGNSDIVGVGNYNVTENYDVQLKAILEAQEELSPISHIPKCSVEKGDAVVRLKEYLESNPQTIIALAYFDMDLYKPTIDCLNLIKPYLVKGSIIGFDDLLDPDFPGETVALREAFDMSKIELKRFSYNSYPAYIQI